MNEEDMKAVENIADHIHLPYNRHEILNRLSVLPKNKAKMKRAIKQRMHELAGMYISLASFVDDDEVDYVQEHLGDDKSKEIMNRVCRDMEDATKEMREFKVAEL